MQLNPPEQPKPELLEISPKLPEKILEVSTPNP
jgi:hypothetical protein